MTIKLIRLEGKAHSVFAQWDLICHQYGNITLSEYNRLTMADRVRETKPIGQREPADFKARRN